MMTVSPCDHYQSSPFSPNAFLLVPEIESGDITINEDEGTAILMVRLVNEIERNFTLDYRTNQVPGGAEGTWNLFLTRAFFHVLSCFHGCLYYYYYYYY